MSKKFLDPQQLLILRHAVPMWEISECIPGSVSRYVAKLFALGAGGAPIPMKEELYYNCLEKLRDDFRSVCLDQAPRKPDDPLNVLERWL